MFGSLGPILHTSRNSYMAKIARHKGVHCQFFIKQGGLDPLNCARVIGNLADIIDEIIGAEIVAIGMNILVVGERAQLGDIRVEV